MISKLLKQLVFRLRGEYSIEQLIEMGMQVGEHFTAMHGTILDPSHCWLIEIGDNVTLAPRVHVICHDASTKQHLGYTKIGRVTIGNNVFVGAETVILPSVTIGSNSIIGANSTVTHDIPENSVAVGSPARVICTLEEYLNKESSCMARKDSPVYDESWTLRRDISEERRAKQKEDLRGGKIGYID